MAFQEPATGLSNNTNCHRKGNVIHVIFYPKLLATRSFRDISRPHKVTRPGTVNIVVRNVHAPDKVLTVLVLRSPQQRSIRFNFKNESISQSFSIITCAHCQGTQNNI